MNIHAFSEEGQKDYEYEMARGFDDTGLYTFLDNNRICLSCGCVFKIMGKRKVVVNSLCPHHKTQLINKDAENKRKSV